MGDGPSKDGINIVETSQRSREGLSNRQIAEAAYRKELTSIEPSMDGITLSSYKLLVHALAPTWGYNRSFWAMVVGAEKLPKEEPVQREESFRESMPTLLKDRQTIILLDPKFNMEPGSPSVKREHEASLSLSLISDAKNTTLEGWTFGVICDPETVNILKTTPTDSLIRPSVDKADEILTPDQLLANTNRQMHNEVTVAKAGLRFSGIFVKVYPDGRYVDPETEYLIQYLRGEYQKTTGIDLPIVKVEVKENNRINSYVEDSKDH